MLSEKEILDGNKLIAEFMGWTYYGHNDPRLTVNGVTYPAGWKRRATTETRSKVGMLGYLCRRHIDLQYRWNWNYLMFAVEKIENIYDDHHGYFGVHISSNSCSIQGTNLHLAIQKTGYGYVYMSDPNAILSTKIESTFYNIVEFIKWYNRR